MSGIKDTYDEEEWSSKLFIALDEDGDGVISASDLTMSGTERFRPHFAELCGAMDSTRQGSVTYDQFLKFVHDNYCS